MENSPPKAPDSATLPDGAADSSSGSLLNPAALMSCPEAIAPTSQSFPAALSSGMIGVTAAVGCTWTASPTAGWITINSTANGTVAYTVAANTAATRRVGTITIGPQIFTVLQGGSFADVPPSHLFYKEIGKLSARGITVGYGNGNYGPEDTVPHTQMAAFVIRALGEFSPPTPPSQRFNDVPASHFFYNFIEQMGARQIRPNGCGGGNYCPESFVTR